ncbi:MAG TPA: hypothetical protein PKX04_12630, partial [Chitinophagales bacterium]|nr:hypothetical protein [Chitinophagales bacterium]
SYGCHQTPAFVPGFFVSEYKQHYAAQDTQETINEDGFFKRNPPLTPHLTPNSVTILPQRIC